MLRRHHSHEDSESGQALVEFALVLPILLLLILGLMDLAKAYERWNEQTSYANTAARYLAVGKAYTLAGTAPGGACVQVTLPNGTYAAGDPVKVDVKSTYNYLGYVSDKIGVASATINGSATTRLEVAPATSPATAVCP